MNNSYLLSFKFIFRLIGIIAVITFMTQGDDCSSRKPIAGEYVRWYECSLSMAVHTSSDCSDTPSKDTMTDDGESSEKEKEKEKEKEEKEKKTEYEDGVLGSLHSIPFESSVVRAYFHHHSAIISCVILDKPTQPPKRTASV